METIFVTGCCGFIGSHTCEELLKQGFSVIGIDNMNDYYNTNIKLTNLQLLNKYERFHFYKEDIVTTTKITDLKIDRIIHLASMAGVRNSLNNPRLYCKVNIEGFINILETSVKANIKRVVYASSSSVYGLNKTVPFSESDIISTCNSPYACSKMAMELFAKTYNQLYNISTIGLRFFTVYGPRGRPDMAPYKFLKAIKNGTYIDKYGDGTSTRDYTYIDDIVEGIIKATFNEDIDCDVFNLGNSKPHSLNNFIETCEKVVNKKALINCIENQLGDVPCTFADINKAKTILGYNPKTSLFDGLLKTYKSL